MGADLYITKLFKENNEKYSDLFDQAVKKRDAAQSENERKKAQREVTKYYNKMYSKGYFRDSYNNSSVAWRLGISWWKDVSPFQNQDGFIDAKSCRQLLLIIQNKTLNLPSKEDLIANHCVVDDKKNSVEVWHKFYIKKHKALIRFLKQAIKHGGFEASL